MFINNRSSTKVFRRQLRKNQTVPEKKIWDIIRNRKVDGLKFFRQYGVGDYILDFYCPAIKLAIEIDGGQHNEEVNIKLDKNRTEFLQSIGIYVLRFGIMILWIIWRVYTISLWKQLTHPGPLFRKEREDCIYEILLSKNRPGYLFYR